MPENIARTDPESSASPVKSDFFAPMKNVIEDFLEDVDLQDIKVVEEKMKMSTKDAAITAGLHGLGVILGLVALNLVASGVVSILAGVGTIPFFGAGVAGIVIGSVVAAGGIAVGVLAFSCHVAAMRYMKGAQKEWKEAEALRNNSEVPESNDKFDTEEVES